MLSVGPGAHRLSPSQNIRIKSKPAPIGNVGYRQHPLGGRTIEAGRRLICALQRGLDVSHVGCWITSVCDVEGTCIAMKGQSPRQAGAARSRLSRRSSPGRGAARAADSFPVVGLGASAGGLDAFRRLLGALPSGTGMAFILIQHLDPTHPSMMVDLLIGHTPMTVQQAADGMPLEPEQVYLIPPGTYPSIQGGALRYPARETRAFAGEIGLVPRTTPIESPQSNGMAEAFAKTLKRDYA